MKNVAKVDGTGEEGTENAGRGRVEINEDH